MIIYLIAAWAFIQTTFGILLPLRLLAKFISGSGILPRGVTGFIGLIVLVVLILLVQLRHPARRFAVVLFVVATAMLGKMLIGAVVLSLPLKSLAYLCAVAAVNVACIVYLTSARFKTLCDERQAARDARRRDKDLMNDIQKLSTK
jgi:hypothetical protein